MLPWLFAYGRIPVHSSRFMPIYWLEMLNLPTTNPADINDHLVAGEYVMQATQRTSTAIQSNFNGPTLEQTLYRKSKTKGGLIGFSLNRSAVHRWIKSCHDRARAEFQTFCEQLMTSRISHDRPRKEL